VNPFLRSKLASTSVAILFHSVGKQGDDDQIVPYKDSALLQTKLLNNNTLKIYRGYPHGMCTTNADVVNSGKIKFVQPESAWRDGS
jgi:non-heme chloroperoxidase